MRAELPWNVAGIPPEAREAARAAARREGLSVGEWLTRRILRSFSDLGEEHEPMPQLDSWGLPQSAASRRDTEEMLAKVSRSETESGDAYRRIEDQLRGVARRLDSSERSQSESNRVLSKTAAEMNIAAREQAQAFDQLGQNVMTLNQRLESLERGRGQDGLKDAVKGLHLGLSRLADQITQTATQSANQIVMVAGNVEQLASRMVEVRTDCENTDNALEQRLGAVERFAQSGTALLDQAVERLEQRLGTLEKTAGEAIGRGLESLERRLALIEKNSGEQIAPGLQKLEQRVGQVEKTAGETANEIATEILSAGLRKYEQHLNPGLERLEHRLGEIEKSAREAAGAGLEKLEQRLGAVEKSTQVSTDALDHTLDKLETHAAQRARDQEDFQRHAGQTNDALSRLEDSIARLAKPGADPSGEQRLDNIERALNGLAEQLENSHPAASLEQGLHSLADRINSLEKNHTELLAELRSGLARHPAPPPEPAPAAVPPFETAPPFPTQVEAPPFAEPHPMGDSPFGPLGESPVGESQDGFADPGGAGFAADFAGDPFAAQGPEPDDLAAEDAQPENFLSAARRSARAAAEKAEAEKRGRLSGFAWGTSAAEGAAKPQSRYIILGVFVLIVVLALAAGLVLSQRLRAPHADVASTFAAPKRLAAPQTPALYLPPPSSVAAPPAQPRGARLSPERISPQSGASQTGPTQSAAPSPQAGLAAVPTKLPELPIVLDRVTQLAKAGNVTAQAVIGLRYLDGTGGTEANPAEAAKWLGLAAEKGQAVAQYRLGTLYERGQGVAADPAKAVHWYLAAANQGNRKAMHNLAVAYTEGAAGKRDMAEAARWFAKAAGLGLSDSQFNLAVLYERGDGVPQSLIDAYKWYSIAAASGDTESRQRLSVLQAQLSDTDRSAAQRSATTFHAAPLNRATNVPPEMADLGN